jgi:hypothetical protein
MQYCRSAREVIDQAIRENRAGEILLYIFATAAASIGLFVMVWSAMIREPLSALAGSVCTGLYWPAMRMAKQIRKENIMIRMLEAPLSKATTARAAANALAQVFVETFKTVPMKVASMPFMRHQDDEA